MRHYGKLLDNMLDKGVCRRQRKLWDEAHVLHLNCMLLLVGLSTGPQQLLPVTVAQCVTLRHYETRVIGASSTADCLPILWARRRQYCAGGHGGSTVRSPIIK